jgi:hypothetical protein
MANCLHRKGFVTAQTAAAVEHDRRLGGNQQQVVSLQTKTETTWWYVPIWAIGLALIVFVVIRNRRRRPGGPALPTGR